MPQPKKDVDESTLPQPELNPLLNPLLAANMGRWAEVYFTSAPERREQAVADLLRELESQSATSPTSSPEEILVQRNFLEEIGQVNHDEAEAPADPMRAAESNSPPESLSVLHCSACEAVNWLGQRFCGMCGAPLPVAPEGHLQETEEELPVATTSWTEHGLSPREESVGRASESEVNSTISSGGDYGGGDEVPEPAWHPPEDLPAFARAAEPVPYRYRAYIGVVVSVLLVGLLYLAWRHGSSSSGTTSSSQSAQLPAMPAEPAASPAPAEPGASQNVARHSAPPTPTPALPVAQSQRPQVKPPKPHAATPRKASLAAPAPTHAPPSSTATAQGGNAELLVAEKFLKGSPDTGRDSKEAATWLWKAVSKKNLAAALLLSDLYVRGDGVAKSCDQARLLLNAGARKGEAAAAERLRNLQNFGCQ